MDSGYIQAAENKNGLTTGNDQAALLKLQY
jgi:hypothetical protein